MSSVGRRVLMITLRNRERWYGISETMMVPESPYLPSGLSLLTKTPVFPHSSLLLFRRINTGISRRTMVR